MESKGKRGRKWKQKGMREVNACKRDVDGQTDEREIEDEWQWKGAKTSVLRGKARMRQRGGVWDAFLHLFSL